MSVYKWQFHQFIQTDDKVYPSHRQVENKCTQKSQGNCEEPHINRIADEAKLRIPSGTENACDYGGVNGFPDYVIGADIQHGA